MKTDHDKLRQDVRHAVEAGHQVQEEVRRITLKALAGEGLDSAAIRRVAGTVADGVQLGLERHGVETRAVLEKAYAGLDEAFAKAAQATSLAIREASGNAREFVSGDLKRAAEDLGTLEKLYLDALGTAARNSRDSAAATLKHFAEHAANSGTAVGRQVKASLEELGTPLAQIAGEQVRQGVASGVATSAMLARAAAGFLAGLADRMEHKPTDSQKRPK